MADVALMCIHKFQYQFNITLIARVYLNIGSKVCFQFQEAKKTFTFNSGC